MSDEALAGLLRAAGGSTGQRLDRALTVLVELLGMRVAYVSEFRGDQRVITHSVSAPGAPVLPVGTTHPATETLCHLIVSGALPTLVADAAADPRLAGHPHVAAFGIGAHAGVPLSVGGRVRGALCCASDAPAGTLNPRDAAALHAVAGHVGDLLGGGPPPADPGLRQLAATVAAGHDLQALTRPMLQLLRDVTGLESTYLTLVDPAADELVVAYAHNTGSLTIPEGLTSSWQDSLCRRSLDEGRACVTDVPGVWSDSVAGRELGIVTYASVPLRDADGRLVGTLCGASGHATAVSDQDLSVMATFAQLISAQLARETALHLHAAQTSILEQRMSTLRENAERDPLTGLANRAGIHRWLHRALDTLAAGDGRLAVAFIDLDHFKTVNDTRGHAVGDEMLRRFATSLSHTGRAGDLHGRLGGDEFIVAAVLPAEAGVDGWGQRVRRAAVAEVGGVRVVGSVGVVCHDSAAPARGVEQLLHAADQAMYRAKQEGAAP
ncbi:sensor domain-containing diguanylate cyclase [Actinoplanes nipponensis]|uniref:GGDEF domain-containing protein n=1 Tax=Actinoplanes nipponensis TaxID=135950 RepID=A0A919JDL2_9ACTN|nr:sensor domain-containing diguanylate cyclase [Actinoplanes nipponensis]GIE48476.1 hypothetical protein Ani05nite_20100 [Actinoplanes nipponensis]